MKVLVQGLGCVTPWGSDLPAICQRLRAGESVVPVEITNAETGHRHPVALVPAEVTAAIAREPRLRRSSPVSLLAAAAGRAALADSGLELEPAKKERTAIVFGVSSGGVQYTRRFYEQVVKQGANAASPMLFPETVYNAPASHLAAMLGLDGATYTLVGDGTVGLQAAHFGAQLLATGDADYVLVVASEELDWILAEAHHDWRLTNPGALLAEGAAAMLLSREGPLRMHVPAGRTVLKRSGATAAVTGVLQDVAKGGAPNFIVDGANGTWVDAVLAAATESVFPGASAARRISPRRQLGEAIGASALIQAVLAGEAVRQGVADHALVPVLGWNQQAGAAMVERAN